MEVRRLACISVVLATGAQRWDLSGVVRHRNAGRVRQFRHIAIADSPFKFDASAIAGRIDGGWRH
jgi:hypothetical protein